MYLLATDLDPRATASYLAMLQRATPQSGRSALLRQAGRGQHVMEEILGHNFALKLLNRPIDRIDSVGLGDIMVRKTSQRIEGDHPSDPGSKN